MRTLPYIASIILSIISTTIIAQNIELVAPAALYQDCSYQLNIPVSKCGENPTLKISGATAKVTNEKDIYQVQTSKQTKFSIEVSVGEDVKLYEIITLIKPSAAYLHLALNDKKASLRQRYRGFIDSIPEKIVFSASMSDGNYIKQFPQKSKLTVTKVSVSIIRKDQTVSSKTFNSNQVNSKWIAKKVKNGDLLTFKVIEVIYGFGKPYTEVKDTEMFIPYFKD